jgi:gamma-glutamylcyclotransferase (GGCT)/AIG2-like uncharacterized protein YtfP
MKQMSWHNYFAYGSNMNPNQMGERCPAAIALGVVTLPGWDIAINERGVATILPADNSDEPVAMEGILWSVTDSCLETLDWYEGVRSGLYRREEVCVVMADQDVEAIAYVASSSGHGDPRHGYLEKMIEGADHFKISPAYRIRLERLSSVE